MVRNSRCFITKCVEVALLLRTGAGPRWRPAQLARASALIWIPCCPYRVSLVTAYGPNDISMLQVFHEQSVQRMALSLKIGAGPRWRPAQSAHARGLIWHSQKSSHMPVLNSLAPPHSAKWRAGAPSPNAQRTALSLKTGAEWIWRPALSVHARDLLWISQCMHRPLSQTARSQTAQVLSTL